MTTTAFPRLTTRAAHERDDASPDSDSPREFEMFRSPRVYGQKLNAQQIADRKVAKRIFLQAVEKSDEKHSALAAAAGVSPQQFSRWTNREFDDQPNVGHIVAMRDADLAESVGDALRVLAEQWRADQAREEAARRQEQPLVSRVFAVIARISRMNATIAQLAVKWEQITSAQSEGGTAITHTEREGLLTILEEQREKLREAETELDGLIDSVRNTPVEQ